MSDLQPPRHASISLPHFVKTRGKEIFDVPTCASGISVLAAVKDALRRPGCGLRPSLTAAARGVTLGYGRVGTTNGPRVEQRN